MADKTNRIATLIRKNITEIIQKELKNPHLGFVTITDVKVSSDISYAKVLVSFINESEAKEGMKILEKSKGFIRSSLASKMDTRRVPELSFILDDGYQKVDRISELLNNAKK